MSQNDPEVTPNHPTMIPKPSQNRPNIIPETAQIIPKTKIIPQTAQSHPQNCQNSSKKLPKSSQQLPKSSQICPNISADLVVRVRTPASEGGFTLPLPPPTDPISGDSQKPIVKYSTFASKHKKLRLFGVPFWAPREEGARTHANMRLIRRPCRAC